jgi:YVTN family beta-propeller protein
MRLFDMKKGRLRTLLAQAGAAMAVSAVIAGCGNNYRPVVTPITPTGPEAQPGSYVVVVSSTGASTPGVATIIDYSGDTVMAVAPIGPGPIAFTIDEVAGNGYTVNSDGTMTNFPVTTSLQAKNVTVSTLPSTALPVNLMAPSSGLWAADLNGNVADVFTGSPQTFKLAVPVATMPVYVAGAPTVSGQRDFVVSQNPNALPGFTSTTCNSSPSAAGENGVLTPIESSYVADTPIGLDPFNASNSAGGSMNAQCPVYAVESTDQKRLFVMNRGSDTVSVINVQDNTLDQCVPFLNQSGQTVTCHPILPLSTTAVHNLTVAAAKINDTTTPTAPPNGTTGMTAIAGPVDAEFNQATGQLVVSNYDGGTITLIDVSLDEYGNDSATFGTTYTIKVGNTANPLPASVTVLNDGSKAYSANQGDCTPDCSTSPNGTVSVVNLSTHTLEKTLTVVGNPRTVLNTQNSEYDKVYAAAPNSPYITIIETTPTQIDVIDTTVLVEGTVVDMRVTTQTGSSGNNNYTSRVPGYGQPCNLPGASQTVSLDACRAIQ